MYVYVTLPSHFSHIVLLIRDLATLLKSTYFDSYWFVLIFDLKKKGHKKMICNRAFSYKK